VPAGGGRRIFALPWLGGTLIGTTDDEVPESPDPAALDHVAPAPSDIDYLLKAANDYFGTALRPGDLAGAFAGVRPLISTGDPKKSVDISRKAELYETSSGMITITGGKLTTWRRMAKMAVDRMVEREARDAPCRTHEIPLGQGIAADELARVEGVPRRPTSSSPALRPRGPRGPAHRRHPRRARPARRRRARAPRPTCWPRSVHAARSAQARTVGEALLRRTRLGLTAAREVAEPSGETARRVARAMAPELGWDDARIEQEAQAFLAEGRRRGHRPR
jgi:glycerol-3-phosphate dehydrogenase